MDSEGGNYLEGIKIAAFISSNYIATRVRTGMRCFSSCAIIFMAGTTDVADYNFRNRTLEPGGLLGFHAPYLVLPKGEFSEIDIENAFAAALEEAGELIAFSASYNSNSTRNRARRIYQL